MITRNIMIGSMNFIGSRLERSEVRLVSIVENHRYTNEVSIDVFYLRQGAA